MGSRSGSTQCFPRWMRMLISKSFSIKEAGSDANASSRLRRGTHKNDEGVPDECEGTPGWSLQFHSFLQFRLQHTPTPQEPKMTEQEPTPSNTCDFCDQRFRE